MVVSGQGSDGKRGKAPIGLVGLRYPCPLDLAQAKWQNVEARIKCCSPVLESPREIEWLLRLEEAI